MPNIKNTQEKQEIFQRAPDISGDAEEKNFRKR